MDRIAGRAYAGTVYRQHASVYDALSGRGARLNGGRWNAPASFEVIYTGLDRRAVDAELRRQLAKAGLTPSRLGRRRLASIRVRLENVLDLRDADVREALGVRAEDLTADDPEFARSIGQAAFDLGFEAIAAPSATGKGEILAIFPANRRASSAVQLVREADLQLLS